MPKFAFLACAMAACVPTMAQAQAEPAQTTPSAATSVDLSVPASAKPAAEAAATPATTGAEVAKIVNTEFGSYDKDGDGSLSATEFDAWMVALKTASDPSTNASSPATRTWLTKAFAQADTDKNKHVSKAELTGFLSQG